MEKETISNLKEIVEIGIYAAFAYGIYSLFLALI